jgi:hypothetical protein
LAIEPQQSLYKPIARIMAAAAKRLRDEKRTFKVREKAPRLKSRATSWIDRECE